MNKHLPSSWQRWQYGAWENHFCFTTFPLDLSTLQHAQQYVPHAHYLPCDQKTIAEKTLRFCQQQLIALHYTPPIHPPLDAKLAFLQDLLLSCCQTLQITDIHLTCLSQSQLTLRQHGELKHFAHIHREIGWQGFRRWQGLSGINWHQLKNESGTLPIPPYHTARVNVLKLSQGGILSIRLLHQGNSWKPQTHETDQAILKHLMQAHGLILIIGPTGSGKTTFLYELLRYLSKKSPQHVISLENPIEQRLTQCTQVQFNLDDNLSTLMAHLLRLDPDAFALQEVRDAHSAHMLAHCYNTGHLTLATMHGAHAQQILSRASQWNIPLSMFSPLIMVKVSLEHVNGRIQRDYQIVSNRST